MFVENNGEPLNGVSDIFAAIIIHGDSFKFVATVNERFGAR